MRLLPMQRSGRARGQLGHAPASTPDIYPSAMLYSCPGRDVCSAPTAGFRQCCARPQGNGIFAHAAPCKGFQQKNGRLLRRALYGIVAEYTFLHGRQKFFISLPKFAMFQKKQNAGAIIDIDQGS